MNRKKIVLLIALAIALIVMLGCTRIEDPIVVKLANGENLTEEEQKLYSQDNETRKAIDEAVAEKKKELESNRYKEATEAEIAAGKRTYTRYSGKKSEFDITPQSCRKFGFLAGSEIKMPKGSKARVVGVFEEHLWFHVEGIKGATFSRNKSLEEFTKEGYQIIKESHQIPPDTYAKTMEKHQQVANTEMSKSETVKAQSEVQGNSELNSYYKTIPRIPYTEKN